MTVTRREQLLADAATRFDDLSSPFETDWLVEHHVTLNECADLAEDIARAIRVYQKLPKMERTALAFHDAMTESGMPEELARMGANGISRAYLGRQRKELRVK